MYCTCRFRLLVVAGSAAFEHAPHSRKLRGCLLLGYGDNCGWEGTGEAEGLEELGTGAWCSLVLPVAVACKGDIGGAFRRFRRQGRRDEAACKYGLAVSGDRGTFE